VGHSSTYVSGSRDLHHAWAAAVEECALGARARMDHAQWLFYKSLRDDMALISAIWDPMYDDNDDDDDDDADDA